MFTRSLPPYFRMTSHFELMIEQKKSPNQVVGDVFYLEFGGLSRRRRRSSGAGNQPV